jgi:hypothetical protein
MAKASAILQATQLSKKNLTLREMRARIRQRVLAVEASSWLG